MNNDLKQKYVRTYGCRFYNGQKKKFHEALKADFEALGMNETVINKRKYKMFPVNDYVYGNLKQAKNIIVVPYDTPEKGIWFKNIYYVNNGNKNQKASTVQVFLPLLLIYLLFVVSVYILPNFASGATAQLLSLMLSTVLLVMIMIQLMKGYPNRNNANRNSSGILAALELASKMSVDERRKTAFVFTDSNRSNYYGDKILEEELSFLNRNPNVIQLNCVGDGEEFSVGYTANNRKAANEMVKAYHGAKKMGICELKDENRTGSSMAYYRKALLITAGTKDDKGYLINAKTGSSKDVEIDDTMIADVVEMLHKYLLNSKN